MKKLWKNRLNKESEMHMSWNSFFNMWDSEEKRCCFIFNFLFLNAVCELWPVSDTLSCAGIFKLQYYLEKKI